MTRPMRALCGPTKASFCADTGALELRPSASGQRPCSKRGQVVGRIDIESEVKTAANDRDRTGSLSGLGMSTDAWRPE